MAISLEHVVSMTLTGKSLFKMLFGSDGDNNVLGFNTASKTEGLKEPRHYETAMSIALRV